MRRTLAIACKPDHLYRTAGAGTGCRFVGRTAGCLRRLAHPSSLGKRGADSGCVRVVPACRRFETEAVARFLYRRARGGGESERADSGPSTLQAVFSAADAGRAMNPTIDAVIFDCDGTLIDSETVGFGAILEEAKKLGVTFAPDEDMLDLKGQAMSMTLAGLTQRLGRPLPEGYETTLRAAMARAFRERLELLPGAVETITGMKRPYCIASNGPRAKMDLTLGLTGLTRYFEGRVFSAYEVGSFKPDPGLFLHAARAMGVEPARCAVVEDSITGIAAGVAAGMTVYAVHAPRLLPDELASRVHRLERLVDLCDAPWNR